jgi:2-dehydro-3-deoxygluconokinase
MPKKVITFGEIMLRLAPPGFLRITQTKTFDIEFGGGEANVAVALAGFGEPAGYVTRLPDNDLGDKCVATLRMHNVDTSEIVRGGERIGVYFLEAGSAQRGSKVIYDRANSAAATIQRGMIDWDKVFAGADWFHWTGITPAISASAADVCLEAAQAARKAGLTVSCDLNYRAKLWKWGKPAGEVMQELVALCDVAIANEEDAEKVFGIKSAETDVTKGQVEADQYRYVCSELSKRFPNLKKIAVTLRGSISASHNTWSGVLWSEGAFFEGMSFDIIPIVDRVGGGDSFAAGLIYGLRHYTSPQDALNFAICASCLKHTILGDFSYITLDEVKKLMKGDASGRVAR